ncbi:NAD-dependent epimerase/dehydratase family protein [Haliscomenobacter hydrossis]|uniref:NAD-dependent epimerase/dehydratase n=1 Tax=Haliscomenobacter hydrossis (strain ATCC 27775 / DSM 1100 / LMG 10767 / O) TaxID=760192 RepID=F4L046_HALH1|nr:NAD-dependent epimerase/dehydratase family protein [Haliscomenobacter hydrossis]AEE52755.1 NAD-dependent epimerase/dehydratase [Haliscomenobacter hydrossis DSM 1100]
MQVLVTGANGFIGCHLCQALHDKGYAVKALVRTTSDLRSLAKLEVDICYGDILQAETLEKAAQGCDFLFHVAGVFAYSGTPAHELINEAKRGIIHVLEAASKARVKRVILTSSSVTLGADAKKNIRDELSTDTLDDATAYVMAKKMQESTAVEYAAQLGLDLVTVHPTLTVGGNDYGLTESNHAIVSYLQDPFKTTWIGGCNMVAVSDVAAGHILLAEKGKSGERYILGSENLEWAEVHKLISQLCGLPGPYLKAYHTSAYLGSIFHEALGFLTQQRPASTREQARMVGNYYWYSHEKAARLGYKPIPTKAALVKAISWLVASTHIPASVRASLQLSKEVFEYRALHP